ncbi:MAG TPA: hypothetical protein VN706_09085 [Gemmatimonadaceae bacterium]|nr:hypothetical protein [Gemmatimonadaceae bacterium]
MRLAVIALLFLSACSHVSIRSPISTAATAGPPSTFVQTTSDTRMTRLIDVGVAKTAAFRAATDYLSQKFSVDVSDARAGFLMTPWQSSTHGGTPDPRYRTRIIVRFIGDDWRQASVRAEAEWQHGDEWDVGYDTQMLEDAAIELRSRLGKKS